MIAATLFALLAAMPVLATGMLWGKLTLTLAQVIMLGAVTVAGSIPFSAIGLLIGTHVSGGASPAITNLLFLPMLWLSGMFIPLPPALRTQTMFWPSFHVQQLAMHAAGINRFAVFPVSWSIGVLLGVTVLSGGLAIFRLSRKG
jgi:ABC-2 type transport system permease protein